MYGERTGKKKVLYYFVHAGVGCMQHAEKRFIVQHHNRYTIHDQLWTTAVQLTEHSKIYSTMIRLPQAQLEGMAQVGRENLLWHPAITNYFLVATQMDLRFRTVL